MYVWDSHTLIPEGTRSQGAGFILNLDILLSLPR